MCEGGLTLEKLKEATAMFEACPDFSDQEWDALCGYTPMTQEIFASCVVTCAEAGDMNEFLELFERFREHGRIWCMTLEEEWPDIEALLKENGITPTPVTDHEILERWTAFREWVGIELGDDVANLLAENIFNTIPPKGAV